ncbi:ABC transporter substrate-binding protein [Dactylosporangium sp. CA-233914]|uniref:ABC transporter substrate-binding protein n=1 Tax=Dactylosporangium sp. CA-233914 TaxID=3239934 RepID=UPI003D92318C
MKPVSLQLDYLAGAQHTGYLVAKAKGFYKDAGIDVGITEGQGSVTTGTLVGQGKADFGIMGAGEILAAASKGIPLTAVFTQIQSSPTAIVYNPAKVQLSKLADLYGHKLGVTLTSTVYKEWLSVAAANHLDRTKIEEVNVGTNLIPAMLAGDVDAIVAYPYNQGVSLGLQGLAVKSLMLADAGEPAIPNSAVVVNSAFAQRDPASVKAFVTATKQGWEYTKAHPDEALDILAAQYPKLNPEAGKQMLPMILALMGDAYGRYDEAAWTNLLELYKSEKLLGSKAITLPDVYNASYLGS